MRPLLYASLVGGIVAAVQGPTRTAAFPTGTAEAIGVCDVQPDRVACWNLEGKNAPDLETSIRAPFANGNEVQFRLGKKNRYLVVRRPQALQPSYRMGTNSYVSAMSTYNGDPLLDFVRISVEPDAKEAILNVSTTIQSPSDLEVPFREGTKSEIEGRTLEIGPAAKLGKGQPRPNDPYGRAQTGLAWTIAMSVDGEPNGGYWAYTPLDESGNPIRYVDAKGRPISGLKALSLEPSLQPGGGYGNPAEGDPSKPKKAANATFQGGYGGPFRATTNIDPKAIAKLRIRASHQETKDLGPFPLDPR